MNPLKLPVQFALRSTMVILVVVLLISAANAQEEQLVIAGTDAEYVGSDQCIECHREQHSSFLTTMHSRAAQATDFSNEPKPDRFDHRASGNTYEVEWVDGKMLHREVLRSVTGERLAVTEVPMETTLGSGTHAKSYLFRDGAFHIQSPITYFSDDEKWAMSPGYDQAANRGFRRTVTVSCVFCHVGSIKQTNENPYKFEILESKIGCERCHGPGETHVKRRSENPDWAGVDDSIVNPDLLSRKLSEAVCQQCHCQGVQAINVSGKTEWDYRPGEPLTDYRVDFQFRRGDDSMRLVGHVEQMHESKCYTETETLTCVTCHDPHEPSPQGDGLVAHYRDKCYQCHEDEACGTPHQERITENGNDCSKCHMPRGDTNVSHFALHDHRIGIHSQEADRSTENAVSFEPILDISSLPEFEQRRLRGLAKYEIHRRHGGNPNFADFNIEATEELIGIKQAGKADADTDAALVWLARDQGQLQIAESLARAILATEQTESMPRIVATNVLAQIMFEQKNFPQAVAHYRTLKDYHRDGRDSYYLGLCEQNTRNFDDAIDALKRSIEIEPSQVGAHAALHAIYLSTGREAEAAFHQRAAEQNQVLQQKYRQEIERMRQEAR